MSPDSGKLLPSGRSTRDYARLRSAVTLLVCGFALVGLFLELRGLSWKEVAISFKDVHFGWLLLAMSASFAIFIFWTMQWYVLIGNYGRTGLVATAKIVLVTAAVENALPFPSGLVSAVVLLRGRAALSYGAALSVLAMDQWVTGLAKVAMVGWAVLLVPIPMSVRGAALFLLVVLIGASLAIIIIARLHENIFFAPVMRPPWGDLLRNITSWSQRLKTDLSAWRTIAVIVLAIAKKATELAAVMAIQRGCGIVPSVGVAAAVVACLGFATMLPAGPAHIGVYEATVLLVYESFHVEPATALTAAVAEHALSLLTGLAPGCLVLAWRLLGPIIRPMIRLGDNTRHGPLEPSATHGDSRTDVSEAVSLLNS